ncbi:uncharacterized protein LOC115621923 [Scaptodrosophila lebanonensis]|uniref:Uncharacterized protein LOC115621923 n=1 Tax=Drosophila lebanonensis TaxID=7225 RepID=A0A6J2T9K4_DROLE|nr:uncharacterized protein LOC115621923 [Scaptodrosophila lebanonensis]
MAAMAATGISWSGSFVHIVLALLMCVQSMVAANPNLSQLVKKQVQQQQQHQQLASVAGKASTQQQQQVPHPHHVAQQQYVHDPESLPDHQELKGLGGEEDTLSDPYQMQESRLPASSNYAWNPYAAAAVNPYESGSPPPPPPVMPMPKMLPFIGYAQPVFIPFPLYIAPDMFYPTYQSSNNDLDDMVMSRAAASGRRPAAAGAAPGAGFQRNSPIYYVRLPPTPYMFVPNMAPGPFGSSFSPLLTYQPMPTFSPFGSVFNLPVNFLANGKPSGIYQMNGAPTDLAPFASSSLSGGLGMRPPTPSNPYRPTSTGGYMPPQHGFGLTAVPAPQQDSKLTSLKRPFLFNGRPEDIYILPNNFNPLYNEQSYY